MTDDLPPAIDEIPVETDEITERAPTSPEGVKSAVADGTRDGSIALLAGGAALIAAARSATRGRLRAILQLTLGAALVRIGLRQRRAAEETVDERVLGGDLVGDADEKEVSDEAHAAVHDDSGLESEFDDPRGDELQAGDSDADASTDVTFTDDEPRSKPEGDAEANDPRRNVDDDEVEIGVSDAATADEASEATGPDPEQAQPAQTDETEPEPGPEVEEDASDMRVDPSEDEGDEDGEEDEDDR